MKEIKRIFSCTRCGFCCVGETTVSLDEEDQKRMVETLSMAREEVSEKYWRITGSCVQMKTTKGHCVFFREGCTIHKGRPWRCAQWPLVPALLSDENNFLTISDSCPGINKDISYEEFCRILARYLETYGIAKC